MCFRGIKVLYVLTCLLIHWLMRITVLTSRNPASWEFELISSYKRSMDNICAHKVLQLL